MYSLLISVHAAAQQLSERRVQMMLDCTMRAHYGPWVEKDLYKDGQLRFNYLIRGVVQGQTGVILVYWNQSQSGGKTLRFILYKNNGRDQTGSNQ